MDNDVFQPMEFELDISVEPEGVLPKIPEPIERPPKPPDLALERTKSDPLSPVLAAGELIPTKASLNGWEPIERPLKEQSSGLPGVTQSSGQPHEGNNTEIQKDELSGTLDHRLLPITEDNLITILSFPSELHSTIDHLSIHGLGIEHSDTRSFTTLNFSNTWTFGSTESISQYNLFSPDPFKVKSPFRPPEINRSDELSGGGDFHHQK